jgi:hypothetical protein
MTPAAIPRRRSPSGCTSTMRRLGRARLRRNHAYVTQVFRTSDCIDLVKLEFPRASQPPNASLPRPIGKFHTCNIIELETAPIR